jgi:hypothetical protein
MADPPLHLWRAGMALVLLSAGPRGRHIGAIISEYPNIVNLRNNLSRLSPKRRAGNNRPRMLLAQKDLGQEQHNIWKYGENQEFHKHKSHKGQHGPNGLRDWNIAN